MVADNKTPEGAERVEGRVGGISKSSRELVSLPKKASE
jgi:hypothetical protein